MKLSSFTSCVAALVFFVWMSWLAVKMMHSNGNDQYWTVEDQTLKVLRTARMKMTHRRGSELAPSPPTLVEATMTIPVSEKEAVSATVDTATRFPVPIDTVTAADATTRTSVVVHAAALVTPVSTDIASGSNPVNVAIFKGAGAPGALPTTGVPSRAARECGSNLKPYHVLLTASSGSYQEWQTRLFYHHYLRMKRQDECGVVGNFTRLLTLPQGRTSDDLSMEMRTVVVTEVRRSPALHATPMRDIVLIGLHVPHLQLLPVV